MHQKDLATLMEGESLLNDSTAIILFSVLLAIATTSMGSSDANYLTVFLTIFFGGILTGCIAGLIATIICLFLNDRSAATITLITLAFAGYYVAGAFFSCIRHYVHHGSGYYFKTIIKRATGQTIKYHPAHLGMAGHAIYADYFCTDGASHQYGNVYPPMVGYSHCNCRLCCRTLFYQCLQLRPPHAEVLAHYL